MARVLQEQEESRAAELEAALAPGELPVHVAVIMDGNGRWGRERGLDRIEGHRESVEAIRRTVTAADDLGLAFLSLYCFSTENANRPLEEVNELFSLFSEVLDTETEFMHRKGIRILVTGMLELLPEVLAAKFRHAIELTAGNDGLALNLCVMYSGRSEIIDAARRIAEAAAAGELDASRLSEAGFRKFLYHPEVPDPDLLIRTSGEQRISNFLLWQLAYSELVFSEVLWPDFSRADFMAALLDYQQRHRRFGKV
ncbi:di-trans,poly-cis-decaprenylcistransferase [bacterium]|nr:di-trans,poly-cis-decaprenylcistransferase [bacterium]